eukprot:gene31034-38356_t
MRSSSNNSSSNSAQNSCYIRPSTDSQKWNDMYAHTKSEERHPINPNYKATSNNTSSSSSSNNNTNSKVKATKVIEIDKSRPHYHREESSSVNSRDSTSNIHTSAFNAALKTKPYPKNSYSAGVEYSDYSDVMPIVHSREIPTDSTKTNLSTKQQRSTKTNSSSNNNSPLPPPQSNSNNKSHDYINNIREGPPSAPPKPDSFYSTDGIPTLHAVLVDSGNGHSNKITFRDPNGNEIVSTLPDDDSSDYYSHNSSSATLHTVATRPSRAANGNEYDPSNTSHAQIARLSGEMPVTLQYDSPTNQLKSMGFRENEAVFALALCDQNLDQAAALLLSERNDANNDSPNSRSSSTSSEEVPQQAQKPRQKCPGVTKWRMEHTQQLIGEPKDFD